MKQDGKFHMACLIFRNKEYFKIIQISYALALRAGMARKGGTPV